MRNANLPLFVASVLAIGVAAPAGAANLLTNGGFEASSSTTTTPPGWTNIGHMEGVLTYSNIPMQPVYEGLRFYDFGAGGNNGNVSVGEGISQSFASIVGATYSLTFGLSAENLGSTVETLRATAGSGLMDYALTPDAGGVFTRPFATETFTFTATAATTTVSFILQSLSGGAAGNNDPLLDGVAVELVSVPTSPVPEPEAWALMLAGISSLGFMVRRRRRAR